MEPYSDELLWMVIVGFLIAFVLAFGIGANDVANSFGTSVGSGVLTIRQACFLATICEISGAVLIGYKVSDTMRKGILEVGLYDGSEQELMLGCVAALASSAIWLLVATFMKLPISGTHSIVGSTIGFSLVARGTKGLKWSTLGTIVGSWFISPVMSGCVSILLFITIRRLILRAREPLKAGFRSLPIFYGGTFFINVLSVVLDGPKLLYMDNIPTWIAISASVVLGLLVALLTHIVIVPMQKRKIAKQLRAKNPVKFNFEDSVESSPSGSPKKNRRPLSLVSEGKQLPAIAEITELASLSDNSPKTFKLAPSARAHDNYKIDPEIIKKAEALLGKTSLDNIDLTITSLNFIDEHHQQQVNANGNGNGNIYVKAYSGNPNTTMTEMGTITTTTMTTPLVSGKGTKLQDCFNKRVESPEEKQQQEANNQKNSITGKSVAYTENNSKTNALEVPPTVGDSTTGTTALVNGKKNLKVIESGTSLELMISSTLSQNSSKVPLIESKETINDFKAAAPHHNDEESEEVSMLFSFLQILTATFGSFAHGGNDVSNAIGPLIAVYMIYREGSVLQKAESPIAILIYGGIGISIGLWLWGRRVIETIGNDLTKITSSTGFTIEVGAAITVLLASKIGLPISTTHCKVGSVVFVGHVSGKKRASNKEQQQQAQNDTSSIADQKSLSSKQSKEAIIECGNNTEAMAISTTTTNSTTGNGQAAPNGGGGDGAVDWRLFRNIAYAWIVTVPVTALLSAAIMYGLCSIVLN